MVLYYSINEQASLEFRIGDAHNLYDGSKLQMSTERLGTINKTEWLRSAIHQIVR